MGARDLKWGEGEEGGPTYSVHKQLGLCREVIVHDIVKHWDINASCLETR